MVRSCTICTHPQRRDIERDLLSRLPRKLLKARYGVSDGALTRHAADHLLTEVADGWQAERERNNSQLVEQLRRWMEPVSKLLAACDEWLTDPNDASRYDLGPRAHEVSVHYDTYDEQGRRRNRRAKLSELLALVEPYIASGATNSRGQAGEIMLVEHKSADPRKLILDAAKTLEGNLRLMAELLGKLQTQATASYLATEEWATLRRSMLAALAAYPEARLALAAALDTSGLTEQATLAEDAGND